MNDFYYLNQENQSIGPFSQEELVSIILRNKLSKETLIWSNELGKWTPAIKVINFSEYLPPPPPSQTTPKKSQDTLLSDKIGIETKRKNDSEWSKAPIRKFERFFAKLLDINIGGTILSIPVFAVSGFLFPKATAQFLTLLQNEGGIYNIIITIFLSIFFSALSISSTGTTIGKFLFGIKIIPKKNNLNFVFALERELRIFVFGLFLGIPLFSFIAMLKANQDLQKKGSTSWDKALDVEVFYRKNNLKNILYNLMGIAILISIVAFTVVGK